ncbi:MAG: lipid A biosynthesis acyltransferase [Thiolinea sp.]
MKSSLSVANFRLVLLHPRYWPTWLGLLVLFPVAWLPWQLRRWLGQGIGRLIYNKNNKRRKIVLTNLQLCFPKLSIGERDQLAQRALQEYACALLDYSVLFFRSRKWLYQQTIINNQNRIDESLKEGQNIVLLLGHSVWLEFAPLTIGQHYSTYGSYKPFKNAVLDWMIAGSRLKDVEFVISREEGMIKLVRSLEPGRMLFFLPDEDHGPKHSTFAPFFNTPKATLTTPARIAKMSKAVCLPVLAFFDPEQGKYCIEIGEALENFGQHDHAKDASLMNQGFEQLVKKHPEQYMWQLKLFRTAEKGSQQPY